MAEVTPLLIKEVREKTGIGLQKCKDALVKTGGDVEKAIEELRKQGLQAAEKRMGRDATEGRIFDYLHATGKIGVMLELGCETDFVAKTEDFANLGKDLCMHIAASSPRFVSSKEIPTEVVEKEKEIYRAQVTGKPDNIREKIVEGRVNKFFEESCLLQQRFVKDDSVTIDALIRGVIAKLGENIVARKFVRMEMGS